MQNSFKLKKRLGQNFLKNALIIDKIVASADILPDSLVIEVGPGAGALTKKLVKKSKYILAYEIDETLRPTLEALQKEYANLNIVYDDFLKRDLRQDINNYEVNHIYVVANLPYYITTPIIEKIIEEKLNIKKIVVMVQKEVGERLAALPGKKEYSSLTVFLNYYFNVKKLFVVGRHNFIPQPKVDSMVISLTAKDLIPVNDVDLFFKIIRDSFRYKRKTIKNNLSHYNLKKIEQVLEKKNLNLQVRAEQIPVEVFCDIANSLSI